MIDLRHFYIILSSLRQSVLVSSHEKVPVPFLSFQRADPQGPKDRSSSETLPFYALHHSLIREKPKFIAWSSFYDLLKKAQSEIDSFMVIERNKRARE
jgi:hypothetical protein